MKTDYKQVLEDLKNFKKELDDVSGSFTDDEKSTLFQIVAENLVNSQHHNIKDTSAPITQAVSLSSGRTFAELVRQSKVKQHPDIVLLASYFLITIDGFETVNVTDIEDAYSKSMLKTSSNTSAMINSNRKKGFMMDTGKKDGKMSFKITMSGIDYIEDILKNQ